MSVESLAKEIVGILQAGGFEAYFAGGAVRDALLQRPCDEIDIATSATPEQIRALFPKTIEVGMAFAVVHAVYGGICFEIATFRSDGAYKDGRHPESIVFSDAKEDAKRRDFTINGLFFNPLTEQIYDFVDGKRDIENKIIRAIGNPYQRFQEDRLRMLRAVRFTVTLNFSLEEETKNAICSMVKELLPAVSFERIWHELTKLHKVRALGRGLVLMHELGLLEVILPSLIFREPIWEDPTYIFASLAPLLEPSALLYQVKRLKAPKKEMHFCESYLKALQLKKTGAGDAAFVELLRKEAGQAALRAALWAVGQEPSQKLLDFASQKMPVTAEDFLKCGVLPGLELGLLLKKAERLWIEEGFCDPQLIVKRVLADERL